MQIGRFSEKQSQLLLLFLTHFQRVLVYVELIQLGGTLGCQCTPVENLCSRLIKEGPQNLKLFPLVFFFFRFLEKQSPGKKYEWPYETKAFYVNFKENRNWL